jgi:hypothetical protein
MKSAFDGRQTDWHGQSIVTRNHDDLPADIPRASASRSMGRSAWIATTPGASSLRSAAWM